MTGEETGSETRDETIDLYLWDFWGDCPNLAVSLMGPCKDAKALVQDVVDTALAEGVRLDPDRVAGRAARALQQGPGWRDQNG